MNHFYPYSTFYWSKTIIILSTHDKHLRRPQGILQGHIDVPRRWHQRVRNRCEEIILTLKSLLLESKHNPTVKLIIVLPRVECNKRSTRVSGAGVNTTSAYTCTHHGWGDARVAWTAVAPGDYSDIGLKGFKIIIGYLFTSSWSLTFFKSVGCEPPQLVVPHPEMIACKGVFKVGSPNILLFLCSFAYPISRALGPCWPACREDMAESRVWEVHTKREPQQSKIVVDCVCVPVGMLIFPVSVKD